MNAFAPDRHTIVYCDASRLACIETWHPDETALIESWISRGRPLIARTRLCNDKGAPVGFPLPGAAKRRISFTVDPASVMHMEPSPRLRDTLGTLPLQWRSRISAVCSDLEACCESVRIVGSLAWQHLVGEEYLHPASDIDVIVTVSAKASLDAALGILSKSDDSGGPRIDGEIVSARGEAVSWRELLQPASNLMIKHASGPKVVERHQWLSQFSRAAA